MAAWAASSAAALLRTNAYRHSTEWQDGVSAGDHTFLACPFEPARVQCEGVAQPGQPVLLLLGGAQQLRAGVDCSQASNERPGSVPKLCQDHC